MTGAARPLAWATDVHLNCAETSAVDGFLDELRASRADRLLIAGDIGEADTVCDYLRRIVDAFDGPIDFVLGNHDFYGGSIEKVRREVRDLARSTEHLHYLTDGDVVPLSAEAGLVGHDGWSDARYGDFGRSEVVLTDYYCIEELVELSKRDLERRLNGLGDEAARRLRGGLTAALDRFRHVYVLTHVPPFREACVYRGAPSDDDWAPHFSCRAVGDVLRDVMAERPERTLTVLCGHTHGAGTCEILPNLVVHTGGAEYGEPAIQVGFELE